MSGDHKKKDQAFSLYRTAFFHKCPECGEGSIYSGFLKVRDKCKMCGFPLQDHDAGDGPAFLVMFITGALVSLLAVILELMFLFPLWLHAVIWVPVILFMSFYLLKVTKSLFIGMHYKNNVLNLRGKK